MVTYPIKNLLSIESRQKIGNPNFFGGIIFGWSFFGDDNVVAGIYRVRRYNGIKLKEKMYFYPYVITHTTPQTVNRSKFADAVSAWQALSFDEKKIYNQRARNRHMFGYHLFLREYMLL